MNNNTQIETLEETARRHANLKENFDLEEELYYNSTGMNAYYSFQAGAKWQAERMYSEEEVLKAQQAILGNIKDALQDENYIIDYLKQFKKK